MIKNLIEKLMGLNRDEKDTVKLNVALPTKRKPEGLAPHVAYQKRKEIRSQILELQSFINTEFPMN